MFKFHVFGVVSALAIAISGELSAATVTYTWDFGTVTGTASPSSIAGNPLGLVVTNFAASPTASPLSNSSSSSGYAGASGDFNFVNSFNSSGPLDISVSDYITFSVTNGTGAVAEVQDFDFGFRATASGPEDLALIASVDGFTTTTSLFSVDVNPNGSWALVDNVFSAFQIGNGETVAFRVYGFNGTGGNTNGRFDDIVATFDVTAVPEPTSSLAFVGGVGILLFSRRRGKMIRSTKV